MSFFGKRWNTTNGEAEGKAAVMATDQVVAPNDECWPNGMSRAPELYLRPMQINKDPSVKNVFPGAVRRM